MRQERIDEFLPRNEGCRAQLMDDGVRQEVPVCMGGMALIGCNQAEQCLEEFSERNTDTSWALCVFRDSERPEVIKAITRVPRARLVPSADTEK